MKSLFGIQQKNTPQSVLKVLLQQVSYTQTATITPQMIPPFMKFTKNLDLAGELVLAITDYIDEVADDPQSVYKCLQILFYCLSKAPTTVFKAAQAFAPEILTINLLTYERAGCTVRDAIQLLTHHIYNHIMRNKPLPSLSDYKLDFKQIPQNHHHQHQEQRQNSRQNNGSNSQQMMQMQSHHKPPSLGRNNRNIDWEDGDDDNGGDGESFGQMISFDKPKPKPKQQQQQSSIQNMLPEKDRPRAPAAFAAFAQHGKVQAAHQLPRGDDALISFDDVDENDEGNEADLFHEFAEFSMEPQDKEDQNNDKDFVFTSFDQNQKDIFEGNDFNPFANEEPKQSTEKVEGKGEDIDLFSMKPMQAHKSVNKNEDLFDPFAGISPSSSKQKENKQNQGSTDIFESLQDSSSKQQKETENTFDPFGELPSNQGKTKNEESFNPFNDKSTPSTKQNDNDDMFDPFANVSSKTTSIPQKSQTKEDVDTFDPFAGVSSTKQQSTNSSNAFDLLNDSNQQHQSKSDTKNFEIFGSSQASEITKQSQKQNNNDIFDPFGDSNKSKANTQNSSNGIFDPFGNSSTTQLFQAANKQTTTNSPNHHKSLRELYAEKEQHQQNTNQNTQSHNPGAPAQQAQKPAVNVFDLL